jgi:hypothetical protein
MARSGFKMRSGNSSTFKMMGSSPMRVDPTEVITKGEEKVIGTTTTETDKSTDTKTDYQRIDKGYTPPSEFMPKAEWDKLYTPEQQAELDAKYKKANTRDIVSERSETTSKPKQKPYVPNPDLTAKRYSVERVGIGTHTYPKGEDGKPLVRLKDGSGKVVFQGSQTDYNAKYGDHLTRGGSETQVGNKKQFLYTRSEQDKSRGRYKDFFKSSATPKKK